MHVNIDVNNVLMLNAKGQYSYMFKTDTAEPKSD